MHFRYKQTVKSFKRDNVDFDRNKARMIERIYKEIFNAILDSLEENLLC